MNEQRNLILTVVLTALILLGWQYFSPVRPAPKPIAAAQQAAASPSDIPGSAPVAAPSPEAKLANMMAAPRVQISSPELRGSLSLTGGRIDDISLTRYHETADPTSKEITLLSPAAGTGAYYAEFGWVGDSGAKTALPNSDTLWTADQAALTADHPVTLTWDNGQGLHFTRKIAIDKGSMFTITDKVENSGADAVSLFPYALVSRWGVPQTQNLTVLHEGPLGYLDGSLKDPKYKDLKEKKETVKEHVTGGWLGFTDKYWLTALIPDQAQPVDAKMWWGETGGVDRFQADWLGAAQSVAPGASVETTSHLFTGAKELAALDAYAAQYSIPRFDLAIDFGWFYFLTKPFFYLLRFLHSQIPNFGVAILVMTVIVRGAFFPIASRSFKSMNKMKALQPEMKKLQERYGEDKAKLQQEMMALYKRENVSPVSGCLPILLQIPVFFALYKVLYVTIEMRQAPFFGWIHDLSAPDPTTIFNLFGLIPWNPPTFLHIGALPLLMGGSMYLQQKMSPQPPDPVQAKMMMMLPLIFTFTMSSFPAGLMVYWIWSNLISIGQQWVISKRHAN